MFVDFWNVGIDQPTVLPMTTQQVAGHLATDWVPSFPPSVGSSFVGWPPYLLKTVKIYERDHLTLVMEAGRTERQWKNVLSWMLGVAGTRQFLQEEGYRWIAPLSAFYPDAVQPVDIKTWNGSFPPGLLVAKSKPGSSARFRPDYLALRTLAGADGTTTIDLAAVESKGTSKALQAMTACPEQWSQQARNVVVSVRETEVRPLRYLVVATRVNPNAKRSRTRRLQLRAWNSAEQQHGPPLGAVAEIAAAHLFGLFRSLGLSRNALAIALAVQQRGHASSQGDIGESPTDHERLLNEADEELREHSPSDSARPHGRPIEVLTRITTAAGLIEVGLSQPLVKLAQKLQRSHSAEDAGRFVAEADPELRAWESADPEDPSERARLTLPFGIDIAFPPGFDAS